MDSDTQIPLIEKKIIYAGTKNATFINGTKVLFHFQTRLCNPEKTLIDDSIKMMGGKPMELVLGKKFKLEIWETIVQNMSINEVARFKINKNLVLQYPFISKTLRDVNKPERDRTKHCCGMMLQNEGVGYKDLNDMLKNPTDLEFTMELVSVALPDEYQKESWQFGEDEKIKMVPALKEKGNIAFKNKEYKAAQESYALAIGFLEQLMLKEKPNDTEWLDLRKQKIPLLLNFAQCKLLEGDYYTVIEHCTSILEIEPDNVKALYRRARAHMGAWNPDQARQDFTRVVELDSSLTLTVKKHFHELDELVKKYEKQDKERYKSMFSK